MLFTEINATQYRHVETQVEQCEDTLLSLGKEFGITISEPLKHRHSSPSKACRLISSVVLPDLRWSGPLPISKWLLCFHSPPIWNMYCSANFLSVLCYCMRSAQGCLVGLGFAARRSWRMLERECTWREWSTDLLPPNFAARKKMHSTTVFT